MAYYATYNAHGTRYQTGVHDTLEAVELEVFGKAYAPSRNAVTFWQIEESS